MGKVLKKAFFLNLLLCICLLAGCGGKNSGGAVNSSQPSDETASGSQLQAKWLDMGGSSSDKKRVSLVGDTLYWAEWNYNLEAKKMENLKVCSQSVDGTTKDIFTKEDIIFRELFVKEDNSRIAYLYIENDELLLEIDDISGNEPKNVSVCKVTEENAVDEIISYSLNEGIIDDECLWLINSNNRIIKILYGADGTTDVKDAGAELINAVGEHLIKLNENVYVYTLEQGTLTLYEAADMSKACEYAFEDDGNAAVVGGDGKTFYVLCDSFIDVYTFDGKKVEMQSRVSFENTGINKNSVEQAGFNGENYYVYVTDSSSSGSVGSMIELKDDGGDKRTRLVLSYLSNNDKDELKKIVDDYNKYSTEYYITMKEYDFRSDYSDFYLDLIKGNGADIFLLNNMSVNVLAGKGVLQDLTDFYASSETVSEDDIETAVLRECSVNGKQYMVMSGFDVRAPLIKAEYADGELLSIDRVYEILMANPDMVISRSDVDGFNALTNILNLECESYIDWDNMTCHYDDGSFARLLEQVKEMTSGRNAAQGEDIEMLYDDKYLLSVQNINVNEYALMKSSDVLDLCDIVSFPGEFDTPRYMMDTGLLFGMNAASKNKAGVWDFFEQVYSRKLSDTQEGAKFSPLKSTNQAIYDKAVNGELLSQGSSYYVPNRYTGQTQQGVGILDESDIAVIKNIVDNTYSKNNLEIRDIKEILQEELVSYFGGVRDADETAKVIQSRVELYLGE